MGENICAHETSTCRGGHRRVRSDRHCLGRRRALHGSPHRRRRCSSARVLLSKADLGNPGDWTGGARKPNLSGELGCANYHPKVSDLVIVGAAAVRYAQPGIVMTNDAQVFRTPAMVEHDWQRGPAAPKFAPCLRGAARRAADEGTSRFVSFRRLSLPAIGTHAIGYRTTFDAKTAQGTIRLVVDIIAVTRGRSEVSLTTTMPLASVPTLFPNELVLAQTIVGRVRA